MDKIKTIYEPTKNLPIASDMSDSSVDEAIEMFEEIKDGRHGNWYALECGSQLLLRAASIVVFRNNMYMDLNLTYGMDEWSIKRSVFCGGWDNLTIIEQKVYSPGA